MKNVPMLSKSRFIAGLQCHLRLWHECYNLAFASEVSPVQQAVFDTGHEVGRLATQLYPKGVLIEEDHLHHEDAVGSTIKALEDADVPAIFEAGFIYDGVRIRVDILERLDKESWNLIEVKSATSAKEIYLPDVAVQYYVLKGLGLNIDRVILMHLNNRYIYDGKKVEVEKLFSHTDLTQKAIIYQSQVPTLLSKFNDMLAKPEEPKIKPDRHCSIPYGCEFWEHCTKEMPAHWVLTLTGISQKKIDELEAQGIQDIRDIPVAFPLSALQDRIRDCVLNNREYISSDLKDELEDMAYPIHFIDFETIFRAIPRYAGTRPYKRFHSNGRITSSLKMVLLNMKHTFVGKTRTRERNSPFHFWMSSGAKDQLSPIPIMKKGLSRSLLLNFPSFRIACVPFWEESRTFIG